jgi:predicted nucleotidyltransferase
MREMSRAPHDHLHHIAQVVEAAVAAAEGLKPDHIMVVGAWCRDILHNSLGRTFPTAATRDLDLALALSSWDAYRALAASFRRAGNTGIRSRIAGENVDLPPFGSVENPDGVVSPPSRGEPFNVWAFEEIFASSLPLALTDTLSIRIPTVEGYRRRQAWCVARSVAVARGKGCRRPGARHLLVRRAPGRSGPAIRHSGRQ